MSGRNHTRLGKWVGIYMLACGLQKTWVLFEQKKTKL